MRDWPSSVRAYIRRSSPALIAVRAAAMWLVMAGDCRSSLIVVGDAPGIAVGSSCLYVPVDITAGSGPVSVGYEALLIITSAIGLAPQARYAA